MPPATDSTDSGLLKKLGFEPPTQPTTGSETIALCKKVFQRPLSDACRDNLEALLGGRFDPVAMNLNMLGLEEEAPLN
jgi:hypothetical protein